MGLLGLPFLIINAWVGLKSRPEAIGLLAVIALPATGVVLLRKDLVNGSAAVALAGAGAVLMIFIALARRQEKRHLPSIVPLAFAAFAIIESLSAMMNGQLTLSLTELGSILTLWVGPLLAISVATALTPRELGTAILIGASSLVVASYALAIAFPDESATSLSRYANWSIPRLAGATSNPNALGAVGLILAISAIVSRRGRVRIYLVLLGVPAILLSQQRAALLGLVLVLLASLAGRSRALVLVMAGVAAAAFTILAPPILRTESESGIADDTTVESRQEVWRFVFEHKWDAPLFGWGPRGLVEQTSAAGLHGYFHAHNQVINAFSVGGIFLLIALLTILGLMLLNAFRSEPAHRHRALVVSAGLVPLFMFESPLQAVMNPLGLPQLALTWMAVTLALIPERVDVHGGLPLSGQVKAGPRSVGRGGRPSPRRAARRS